ncbi:hypothetical protein KAR48_13040 [bacterium]|nr:hypothetical protein [bacterium]
MIFILSYLGFIALDMLIITGFISFGQLPVNFFLIGTGFTVVLYLYKYILPSITDIGYKRLIVLFSMPIIITCMDRLFDSTYTFIQIFYNFSGHPTYNFIRKTILILFFCVQIIYIIKCRPFRRWLLFSSISGLLLHLYHMFFKITLMVYRFYGILDFIVLFGWLMVLVDLIREFTNAE